MTAKHLKTKPSENAAKSGPADKAKKRSERVDAPFVRVFALWFCASAVSFCAAAREDGVVYAAPNGDDAAAGTRAAPVRTVVGARDRLRARRAAAAGEPAEGWRVEFADGTYSFDAAVALDGRDGGTRDHPVRWTAAHRGAVVFTGAVPLGWRPCADADVLDRVPAAVRFRVLEADWPYAGRLPSFQGGGEERVREISDDPVQLFAAGRRLDCARWPNGEEEALTGLVGAEAKREAYDGVFRAAAPRLEAWAREPELWAYGQWQYQFHQMTVRVLRVEPRAGTLKVGYPDKARFGIRNGMEWHVLNALSEMDRPGEWVVLAGKRRLYALPPEDAAPMALAGATNLLTAAGLTGFAIEGVRFECARGDAVKLERSADVSLRGCVFAHHGGWGLRGDEVARVRVDGCDFEDLGKGGVRLKGGRLETLERGDCKVVNCHVHHYGVIRPSYSPGVFLGGVGNAACRNLIHHSQHQGVLFQGNDHLVARNVIHDVCTRNDDAGAIYCNGQLLNWLARGTIVEGNLIHHVGRKPVAANCEGIYLDDWSSGVTVRGNVVCRANRGVHVGGGHLNVITNNLFIATRPAVMVGSRGVDSFAKDWLKGGKKSGFYRRFAERTADAKWLAHYPDCAKILAVEDETKVFDPIYDVIRANALVGSGPVVKNNNVRAWPGLLVMEDNEDFAAEDLPGLADFDFRPAPGSALAAKLGDLRIEETGLFESPARASPPVRFGAGATRPVWPPEGAYDPPAARVDVSFAGTLPSGEKSFADACVNAENPSGRRVSTGGYFTLDPNGGWQTFSFSFTPRFDCTASLDVLGSYGDKTLYDDVRVEGAVVRAGGFEESGAWKVYDEGAKLGDFGPPFGVMDAAAAGVPAAEGRRCGCANHEHWLVQKIELKKGVPTTVRFACRPLARKTVRAKTTERKRK